MGLKVKPQAVRVNVSPVLTTRLAVSSALQRKVPSALAVQTEMWVIVSLADIDQDG
jgi:hypothetical protein